jgi:hypothetical protein
LLPRFPAVFRRFQFAFGGSMQQECSMALMLGSGRCRHVEGLKYE